jgi:RNA polymerase sigma-70 factor (ECF subfamily)
LKSEEQPEAFSQVGGSDSELIAALQCLSTTDQEILALAAWEELKPREAAVVLDVSPAWYRVRLHRAKRRLLRELERSAWSAGQPVPVHLTREGAAK